ncbi:MAG TPA: ribosome small subunit-dependent GTPase A [Thermomicrobiales bacterium]|nr:ribosome small subunit-dependent GTPase A [Thermomicrobiales bacterium]
MPSISRNRPTRAQTNTDAQRNQSLVDVTGTVGPPAGSERGLVMRAHGLWYEVLIGAGEEQRVVLATIRGQLKRRQRRTDIVAVGDRVHVSLLPDNEAVIEYVEPRSRALVRTARHTRDTDQVILANPDQVLFVFATKDPTPHPRMLDRFLILAELQRIPVWIAIGKMDLDDPLDSARVRFRDYERIYPVSYVSVSSGEGVPQLREAMAGKVTVVAGPSGVGKSSLLNLLDPENQRDVGEISVATGKGRHTTVGSRLHRIGDGTFVADTPGMRSLAMHAVTPDRLPACYREFLPYLENCFYQDCTHVHEPGCDVIAAVNDGAISRARYESYVALRTGEEMMEGGW